MPIIQRGICIGDAHFDGFRLNPSYELVHEMAVKISGVKWTETVKVVRRGNAVVLEVMTKAGRLYRSTSFRLTKEEAAKLAAELQKAAGA